MLIVIEGHDGAGKSRLAKGLTGYLQGRGDTVLFEAFPSGGIMPPKYIGGKDRIDFFLKDFQRNIPPPSDSAIRVTDRSFVSTLVYQGYTGGYTKNQSIYFQYIMQAGLKTFYDPELVWVYMYCAAEEAARRIQRRGASKDEVDVSEDVKGEIELLQLRYQDVFDHPLIQSMGKVIQLDTTSMTPEQTLETLVAQISLTTPTTP